MLDKITKIIEDEGIFSMAARNNGRHSVVTVLASDVLRSDNPFWEPLHHILHAHQTIKRVAGQILREVPWVGDCIMTEYVVDSECADGYQCPMCDALLWEVADVA